MRRSWTIAVAAFAALTTGLVGLAAVSERRAALSAVEDRTRSVARMIAAHGDAAIADARTVITAVEGGIAGWDLQDPEGGRRLFDTLRDLILGSPHISSAWVLDGQGITRLDSRAWPPAPIDVSHRSYFRQHAARPTPESDVISGTDVGVVTGAERFTVSRAVPDGDGGLHAVIVVGVLTQEFDALYAEAATWPGARAGLFTLEGDALARLQSDDAAMDFIEAVAARAAATPSGSAYVDDDGQRRLASWHRSELPIAVFATSSQTIASALAEWRRSALALVAVALLAIGGFTLLAIASLRAAEARESARFRGLAIREVHHRVKNALQLIVSMTALRIRQSDDPAVRAELHTIATQVRAIADVEDMLQNATTHGEVDAAALIGKLCERLQPAFAGEIRFSGGCSVPVAAGTATSIAIIANELILNALKHGRSLVEVACEGGDGAIRVSVQDDGPGLPPGFAIGAQGREGFGLTAARSMARSLGADLAAGRSKAGGAAFRLRVPLARAA